MERLTKSFRLMTVAAVALPSLYGTKTIATESAEQSMASVGVQFQSQNKNSPRLLFSITNTSQKELVIDRCDLPWMSHYTLKLEASRVDKLGNRTGLTPRWPISDPPAGTERIAPGEVISGSVSLRSYFEGIQEALATNDILVRWSFDLGESAAKNRFRGNLLIPAESRL
jgi:hypothetical protein